MDTVIGATSTSVPQPQKATSDTSGMFTNMLTSTPVSNPVISPTIPRPAGDGGQKHVPLMRTMQQDESAALSAVKAAAQSAPKHPEVKKGGFFSSFLSHHDSPKAPAPPPTPRFEVKNTPSRVPQSPQQSIAPQTRTIMSPPQAGQKVPSRVMQPAQVGAVQPVRTSASMPGAQQQSSAPPSASLIVGAPPISQSLPKQPAQMNQLVRATPTVQVQTQRPALQGFPNKQPTVPVAAPQSPRIVTNSSVPAGQVIQQKPAQTPSQMPQSIPNVAKRQFISPQQPASQRPAGQPTAPQQRTVAVAPASRPNFVQQPQQPQNTFSQVRPVSVGATVSVPLPKIAPPAQQLRDAPKVTSAPAQATSATQVKVASPVAIAPIVRASTPAAPKIESTMSTRAVVPARDSHPTVTSGAVTKISSTPPIVTAYSNPVPKSSSTISASPVQGPHPSAPSEPLLPKLTKLPPTPATSSSEPLVSRPPTYAAVSSQRNVVSPGNQVPPSPTQPVPAPISAVSPITHGMLPSRVDVRSVSQSGPAKHPLSEVFPSKQEVIDGAHDALVKNGSLAHESVSGAADRVTNYVDVRLEDENLFGGKNKGTTQVVWGIVKELKAAAVIGGDLPTEEHSQEEHVNHELHVQAYLMVRDVAKKLSLSAVEGETAYSFLLRAAASGPLF